MFSSIFGPCDGAVSLDEAPAEDDGLAFHMVVCAECERTNAWTPGEDVPACIHCGAKFP